MIKEISYQIIGEIKDRCKSLDDATLIKIIEDVYKRQLDACKALLLDLKKLLRDGDVIGISWGRTMEYFVKMLDDYYNNRKGIKIVQLNGNVRCV